MTDSGLASRRARVVVFEAGGQFLSSAFFEVMFAAHARKAAIGGCNRPADF